jgi:hypothetical protein
MIGGTDSAAPHRQVASTRLDRGNAFRSPRSLRQREDDGTLTPDFHLPAMDDQCCSRGHAQGEKSSPAQELLAQAGWDRIRDDERTGKEIETRTFAFLRQPGCGHAKSLDGGVASPDDSAPRQDSVQHLLDFLRGRRCLWTKEPDCRGLLQRIGTGFLFGIRLPGQGNVDDIHRLMGFPGLHKLFGLLAFTCGEDNNPCLVAAGKGQKAVERGFRRMAISDQDEGSLDARGVEPRWRGWFGKRGLNQEKKDETATQHGASQG